MYDISVLHKLKNSLTNLYWLAAISAFGDRSNGVAFDCFFINGVDRFVVNGNETLLHKKIVEVLPHNSSVCYYEAAPFSLLRNILYRDFADALVRCQLSERFSKNFFQC